MASLTPTMTSLLIALVVLVCTGIGLIVVLFILRSRRKSRQRNQESLPVYNAPAKRCSNHRRLTISATSQDHGSDSIYVYNEKKLFIDESPSPPHSPVPEIRITFPEEEDAFGKRKSGRVVVVKVSETGGVGLEPYHEDKLPPYQKSDEEKFHSLDLDRIGGLKELERGPQHH